MNLREIIGGGMLADPDGFLSRLQREVAEEWASEAYTGGDLSASTADEYVAGIEGGDMDPTEGAVSIVLSGTVPNIVENGLGPGGVGSQGSFDLRKQVLASPKAKAAKDGGRYMSVPMWGGGSQAPGTSPGAMWAKGPDGGMGDRRSYSTPTEGDPSSFRTISEDGPPWTSPGVEPRLLAEKVAERVGDAVDRAWRDG